MIGQPGRTSNSPSGFTTISVSTTFQPTIILDGSLPDLVLAFADQVFFYVHRIRLLSASSNNFSNLISFDVETYTNGETPTIHVPEPADVLNVVLHTIYDIPVGQFQPSVETVSAALDALGKYGVEPRQYAKHGGSLYSLVLSFAPHRPIDTFALAASHGLEDVAVAASAHLLSYPLSALTDDLAECIGPIYLKRLFFLHLGRLEALKKLLVSPPRRHPEVPECSEEVQAALTRAWALATAHLVWEAKPSTFLPGGVGCESVS